MKKIFLTYFPTFSDIHLFKDPGQIPYRFKKVFGFDSYIITTMDINQLTETQNYINLIILPKSRLKRYFQLIKFIIKNRKYIAIINIFQISFHNIFIAWLIKLLVPKVFIYLKMDNCIYTGPYPWEKIFDKKIIPNGVFGMSSAGSFKMRIKDHILKKYLIYKVNLFSVEDEDSKDYYEKKYPFFKNKIVTVFNGHVIDLAKSNSLSIENKKHNIILNVGRLGTYSKATDILLESFSMVAHHYDWELHLVGTIDDNFKTFLEDYFKRNPGLETKIIFHGHLKKEELFKLYRKSKIFCLPSRYEGFALVFAEAMYFKSAIITTKYVSPRKMIENKCGIIVEKDNVNELAAAMIRLMDNPELITQYGETAHKIAEEKLNWDKIIKLLYIEMVKRGLRIKC